MNQGRIWCVVSPNVGLPLMLGSVALTSLIVHYSVLSHVSWFGAYWNGGFKKTALSDSPSVGEAKANSAFTVSVSPVVGAAGKGETSFVVTVSGSGGVTAPAAASADPAVPMTIGDATPPKSN